MDFHWRVRDVASELPTRLFGVSASLWSRRNNGKQGAYYRSSKSTDAKGCKIFRMAILEGAAARSVLELAALRTFFPPTVPC